MLLSRFTCDSRRGHWLLRLSVDLEHLGHLDESLSVAEEGALDPWVRAGSKMALQRRIVQLAKPPRRWRVPNCAHFLKRKIKEVSVCCTIWSLSLSAVVYSHKFFLKENKVQNHT